MAADTISRPTGLPTQTFTAEKAEGFDEQLRNQHGLGPETTWAGYSFAFTIDLPQNAQRRLPSSFEMPSGAKAHFILLDPVDYVIARGELREPPKQYLERKSRELKAKAGKPGVEVANGWIGEVESEFTIPKSGFQNKAYFFCSDAGYLQVNLKWPAGNAQAEEDARALLQYGLWSIKRL